MTRSETTVAAVLRWTLPPAVVSLAAFGAWRMIAGRRILEPEEPAPQARLIRAVKARREVVTLRVRGYGTVRPKTVTTLVAQVGGKVIAISPALASGGFFDRGDVLVTIEPRDFELAAVRAKARIAQARRALAVEERAAKIAVEEWQRVMGKAAADPLARHEPQLAEARAGLAAAEADLAKADLDLERTRVRAPYAGRASTRLADVGQVVLPGTRLAVIHDTSRAEVRIALPDAELAFLDLPVELGRTVSAPGPRVALRATFAGRPRVWNGRIARVEDEVDPRTRMVRLVAAVDDPYARRDETAHPPLPFGLFVAAEIEGRRIAGFTLPRDALRGGGRVWVVDGGRLRARKVDVLRTRRDSVLVDRGLAEGDLVCVSPIETFVEGMLVEVDRAAGR